MNVIGVVLMCVALVACGVATPEARTVHVAGSDRATTTDSLPISGPDALGAARSDGEGSRLGPPSSRGLGLRRVDRAASATTRPNAARY
jgi:hypothetical protein